MAFSPQFLDELKHRFTLSDLIGRSVKLVRRGREHTGCCPFHNEKTPSFTVNDVKGFYHCFGCGAHGSVFDFVMENEGLSFPEAIERLAGEAGMEVPKPSPEEMRRHEERASLTEVMQMCADWYHEQLTTTQAGRSAYEYISGRGLSDATLMRFAIGYAPNSKTALKQAMMSRNITEQQLVETGMLIKPENGGMSYDRFRDRLMFPISDRQGRMIAFGGRALSKEAKAKYLNSPETTLFHKGQTLYNWANARQSSYKSGQVLVVEGYMDVIALAQFSIEDAVAPLGTALTEEQITHLWQMTDEPFLCFDGDNAGRRAAERAMERALPMVRPGKSLRFVFMPEGDDPDTLIQREGKGAFEKFLDTATPMATMLWETLTHSVDASTPERRAGLEKTIFSKLAEIQDEQIKKLYQQDFRNRLFEKFKVQRESSPQKGGYRGGNFKRGGGKWGKPDTHQASEIGSGSRLAKTQIGGLTGSGGTLDRLEKIIIATVVFHPEILVRYEESFSRFEFSIASFRPVQTHLLNIAGTLDAEEAEGKLKMAGVWDIIEVLKADPILKKDWFIWPEAALSDALTGFDHVLARYYSLTDSLASYREAERDYMAEMSEESHERFVAAQAAYRESEEKIANIDNFGLESGRIRAL
ncbi:DNA primase [Temperatibacter marinus]|uniref:DNA primase n=1 Tax=Temperatibacter marinus TaxID=1456591 RepID=A0AA52H8R4_9PROT|nr:DNA primase [Temperatibacter marinus]WND01732.1 DNA primase [Temperatibacter marinus]